MKGFSWVSMLPAIFGLAGVVVGGFMAALTQFLFQRHQRRKGAEYLCIKMAAALERFAFECVDVANDDGLCHGQTDSQGCHRAQVLTPKFDPQLEDVDWKSLPASLMDAVLSFPREIEQSDRLISSVSEYVATPPDFFEFFEGRQYEYSKLGLAAFSLVTRLREYSGLPARVFPDWNPLSVLAESVSAIDRRRSERARAFRPFSDESH